MTPYLLSFLISSPLVRQVTTVEGEQFARNHGLAFIETSARTGECVEEVLQGGIHGK